MTRIEEIKAALDRPESKNRILDWYGAGTDDVRWLLSLVEEARAVLDSSLAGDPCRYAPSPECQRDHCPPCAARAWLSEVEEAT